MPARKAVIPPKPKHKETTLLIDPEITNRGYRRSRQNPLDAELAHEDAMLAQDLKSMRVEEMVLKRRKRMKQYEKEIEDLDDPSKSKKRTASPGISVAMARQIAKLPEAEQEKIIQTFSIFRNIDDPVDRGSLLLPMLVGYSKKNPQSSQMDMATYAKAMTDQFKLGIDVMKTAMPQRQESSQGIEMIKIFGDLIKENIKQPMAEMMRQMQPQQSAFEQIITNPDLYSRAKEIGFFGRSDRTGGSTDIDLKIEQLRGEREMSGRKMDLEWKIKMLEMDEKSKRSDTMLQALTPLSALFAGPIDQRMRNMGRQQAQPQYSPPPQHNPAPPNQPQTTIDITCTECGYKGEQPIVGPPPPQITCPGCGVALNVGGPPTGGN